MVRVISVHHFASQRVQTVEQPTACAVAPPGRLLLALSSHCIEVIDLNSESEMIFTFPTVDEVQQLIHCMNGDFIATLEAKHNRQNRNTNFVRVYVNWDSVAAVQQSKMTSSGVSLGSSECGMVQPMRARIAGRVTPTTNQTELSSLEMIEIPVHQNPQRIACCQASGNIIILTNKCIFMHSFKVKVHDISKLRFIDFEELPFSVELSFNPTYMELCENYIACMSNDSAQVFQITYTSTNNVNDACDYSYNKFASSDITVDYEELLRNESKGLADVTVHLPSIVKANSAIYKHSPFTFCDKEMNVNLKCISPLENHSHNYVIENLIHLKLRPILIENAQSQMVEEFKCVIVKPLYISKNKSFRNNQKETLRPTFLESEHRRYLQSVAVLIATQQEGYLYYFTNSDKQSYIDNCIAVYPFTAPVYKIVMEDYLLHALTETGLETYTLRIGHQLCKNVDSIDNCNTACPSVTDPVCLVGLRPFLGVEEMLLAENNLVLLANSENSPTHSIGSNSSNPSNWTLYNLELPTPKNLYTDILATADIHKFSSPLTYCHLMSEAHIILRISLMLYKWKNTPDNAINLVMPIRSHVDELMDSYRCSCALLADHFIMTSHNQDYVLALPYYKMAGLSSLQVLKRVHVLQQKTNVEASKGLLHYLKTVLLDIKLGPDADKIFASSSAAEHSFGDTLIELLEKCEPHEIAGLVLKSDVLREYCTDKLIALLTKDKYKTTSTESTLALAVLQFQKCDYSKGHDILDSISEKVLHDLLRHNWQLLFETTVPRKAKEKVTTFSELSIALMSSKSTMLSELLVHLIIEKKVINLHKTLKVFLDYIPSRVGCEGTSASRVLQLILEQYFVNYFARPENEDMTKIVYDRPTHEAVKILVRSYLSQLQMAQLKDTAAQHLPNTTPSAEHNGLSVPGGEERSVSNKENSKEFESTSTRQQQKRLNGFELFETKKKIKEEKYLLAKCRFLYLDKLPPFNEGNASTSEETRTVLKKLQALVCSQAIPKQVLTEMIAFLTLNPNLPGNIGLQSLTMSTNDGALLILDMYPQCIIDYGKDRCTGPDEWRSLVCLIQRRILRLANTAGDKNAIGSHKQLLKDAMTHLATNYTLENFLTMLPPKIMSSNNIAQFIAKSQNNSTSSESAQDNDSATQNDEFDSNSSGLAEESVPGSNESNALEPLVVELQNYEEYVKMCKDTMHANQINKLITATGQQLLATLNL